MGFGQHRHQRGMIVVRLDREEAGALTLAMLDIGFDRAADDGPGPHDRHLHHQILQLFGRVRGSIWIWARLSIWKTPIVSPCVDHLVDGRILEIDPAEIDRRFPAFAISSRHSSTSESIPSARKSILTTRASSQESLSHCARKRPSIAAGCTGIRSADGRGGDDHAADMLGDMPGEAA